MRVRERNQTMFGNTQEQPKVAMANAQNLLNCAIYHLTAIYNAYNGKLASLDVDLRVVNWGQENENKTCSISSGMVPQIPLVSSQGPHATCK